MAVAVTKPPTGEVGATLPGLLPSWRQLGGLNVSIVDDPEYVPELRWPTSVRTTFPRMRHDTQLEALRKGTFLPISRYAWGIDPNGADQKIVDRICAGYNLPLIDDAIAELKSGRRTVARARSLNRFSFPKHQAEAFKACELGHYPFEQDGEIGADGLWHIRKLAARPPKTIGEIKVAPDGGLMWIKQSVGLESKPLEVGRLVVYVWDQDPGDWLGRSMYRSCYREWLIKDRLLRVDARNHEKGGGSWYGVAAKDATPVEKQAIAQAAADMNALGGPIPALPQGAELKFERPGGTVSTIDSINRHDEAMARAWLLMSIQLGSTQTGARAVGDVHQELWGYAQEGIAIWFRDVFNEHVIEDDVDWNDGPDTAYVPRLGFQRPETVAPPVGNAIVDPATQAALDGAPALKVAALRATYARENRAYRARLAKLLPNLDFTDEQLAFIGDVIEADEVIEDELHTALAENRVKPTRGKPVRAGAGALPDRPLRRDLLPHEVKAAVDFKAVDAQWQAQVDSLVAQWQQVRATQIAELAALIEAAGGDLTTLATIQATAVGGDLIAAKLTQMAQTGAAEAVAEAARQGVAGVALPDLAALEAELAARSAALEQLLANSLSQAAANKAVQISGGALAPADVATAVTDYLGALSDTYLADQFGGATSAAQNAGRLAAMEENGASLYYASELLDANTCDPCAEVDGTEYATADEAAAAYPAGGFVDCEGGPRCRGVVVAVYDEAGSGA